MSQKSFIIRVEEFILRFTKPDYMDSEEKILAYLKNKSKERVPGGIFKSPDFCGAKVFSFGDESAKNTILFIHGGAYIHEINYQHLLYCFLLSRKLNAYVIAPVYPLAPSSNAEDAYDVIIPLYEKLRQRRNLILMGDSAGGGFVHSICQHIKTIPLSQPDKIITFSPWVDISMTNTPYNSKDDVMLGDIGLKEIGRSWAGKLDTHDSRVSPFYGDNTGLADTIIFTGTDEIFFKDIRIYAQKLKKDGVNVNLIEGEGMFHIYPMFPSPEARKSFKEIKKEIMG